MKRAAGVPGVIGGVRNEDVPLGQGPPEASPRLLHGHTANAGSPSWVGMRACASDDVVTCCFARPGKRGATGKPPDLRRIVKSINDLWFGLDLQDMEV